MGGLKLNARDRGLWIALAVLCCVNIAVQALAVYPAMPETVPIHWGVDGSVDGWGDKWWALSVVILPLFLLALLSLFPKMDPKGRNFNSFKGVYQGFTIATVLFTIVLSWLTPLTVFGLLPERNGPTSTVLFAVLGRCSSGLAS